jgi:hypothetical protein
MALKNLWGTIPAADKERTPYVVIAEQAALLGRLTNNVLEGRAERSVVGDTVLINLDIVAPFLGGYSYQILTLRHSLLRTYPVTMADILNTSPKKVLTEKGVEGRLRLLLSSPAVKRVIASLLAQSREKAP